MHLSNFALKAELAPHVYHDTQPLFFFFLSRNDTDACLPICSYMSDKGKQLLRCPAA